MNVDKLLESVLTKVTPAPITELYGLSAILETFCPFLKFHGNTYWEENSLDALTHREFYRVTDSMEKYGDSYSVIYFQNEPVCFIRYFGRNLAYHEITIINDVTVSKVNRFLKDEHNRLWAEMGYDVDEPTLRSFFEIPQIISLNLNELPVLSSDKYSEGEMFNDLVTILSSNTKPGV